MVEFGTALPVATVKRGGARRAAPRVRMPMADRHEQLLGVATRLFATHGFHGATTRQIATAAGVTEAVIFQHFPDKEALYSAALARASNQTNVAVWLRRLEAFDTAADPSGFLKAIYDYVLQRHENDAHLLRLIVYSALEEHALSRRIHEANAGRLYRVVQQFVLDGQSAGRFRSGPAAVFVRAILGLPVYHVFQRRLFRPAWPAVDPRELIDHGVEFTLAGLRAAPAAGRTRPPKDDSPDRVGSRLAQ